ncbi:Protein of unknown function (DUF2889) [Acididesulfobacillus acetoxydans]|uniref:DUF2889 domain-containing protein n=1 Tax=Acididesulfobacillus acetoxydans TaxID=1561005 RepID=A0A8S0X357_9FIRM|nr:DUF2889 domain-containing protein [Acididesulfobacillus acetoxydans]CAA7599800.1 Protein of unknown function (DUF2889) [Acididesulfobacillus acetoxydans]CEJ07366.1 Protein of unknown function (DUF2889) [Acididesulfobacillus acetoxydans]
MHLFNRSIIVNVQSQDYKSAQVSGVFLDSHHELCLDFSVDLGTFEVTAATAEWRRAPHTDCAQVEKRAQGLVGLKLTHGVRKEIQKAVGQEQGCTHLMDLALECVKGFVQARFSLLRLTTPEPELSAYVEDYLKGSCYHFRRNKG